MTAQVKDCQFLFSKSISESVRIIRARDASAAKDNLTLHVYSWAKIIILVRAEARLLPHIIWGQSKQIQNELAYMVCLVLYVALDPV